MTRLLADNASLYTYIVMSEKQEHALGSLAQGTQTVLCYHSHPTADTSLTMDEAGHMLSMKRLRPKLDAAATSAGAQPHNRVQSMVLDDIEVQHGHKMSAI